MQEETKEEYLSRLKKEREVHNSSESLEEINEEEKQAVTFKSRFKSFFFLLLFALFMYAIYQIFGMLKSN